MKFGRTPIKSLTVISSRKDTNIFIIHNKKFQNIFITDAQIVDEKKQKAANAIKLNINNKTKNDKV